jgi:hypothetical protein
MDNPKAPFGLESFDLEAIRLRATRHELVDMSHSRRALDRLMAERKCRGCVLNSKIVCYHYVLNNVCKEKVKSLVMEGEEICAQKLCSCHNHPLTQC